MGLSRYYDALARLTSAAVLGGPAPYGESYEYDDNGNASTRFRQAQPSGSAHRLKTKGGMTLYYDDVNHKHAVSSTSTNNAYFYDANGNQITRVIAGVTYTLAYACPELVERILKRTNGHAPVGYRADGSPAARKNNQACLRPWPHPALRGLSRKRDAAHQSGR